MKKNSKKVLIANIFGTLGYYFCFFLWCWVGVIFLPIILSNEHVEEFLLPVPKEEQLVAPTVSEGISPIALMIVGAVTVTVVLLTVLIFVRIPIAVAKTGKTVTTKAATSALPLVAKHKKLPKKEKKRLTVQLVKLMKLLSVVLPVGLLYFGKLVELPLPLEIVLMVGSGLALISLLWFSAQYITARLLSIDPKQLV
jgi:hypothetical protein